MSGVQIKRVGDDEAGMRLDRWFRTHFPAVKHGQLEKFLRKGDVRVDGGRVKSNRRLEAGEEIRIPPLDAAASSEKRRPAPIKVDREQLAKTIAEITLYEDNAILVLNKPFGLAVQGGTKTSNHVDGMLAALASGDDRFRLVHRLDKDTGGVLIIAKTRIAANRLADAFKNHEVEKTYWALLAGILRPSEGTISLPIAKRMIRIGDVGNERVVPADGDDAKRATTHFQLIEEAGPVCVAAMRPVTGRTHQLRVHSAAMGAPIVGDGKYGGVASRIEGVSQKLHLFCREMAFAHPVTKRRITVKAPLTGHMRDTWRFFTFDENVDVEWPEELM